MTTITTKQGKEFECDMVAENPMPPRLYFHIVNSTMADVASTFTAANQLPIKNYAAYTELQSISNAGGGINVALKKKGT